MGRVKELTPAQKRMLTIQKKKNAEFNALSPMKKRVAVAQDVLLQLKLGKFKAGEGYGRKKGRRNDIAFPLEAGDLQANLMAGMECVGCAKAACLISRARLGDEVVISGRFEVEQKAHEVSRDIFGRECADLIEALYEGWSWPLLYWDSEKDVAYDKYADVLPPRYTDPRSRMEAIYQNIVKNKGKLKIGKYRY